jgi:outer membrane biosynthesis protein TonB
MGKDGAVRTAGATVLLAVWVVSAGSAQSNSPAQPTVLDSRQATRLLLIQVSPDYPAIAHTNYIQGPVQMELFVGSDGHVRKAHVLRGNALLAASALKAVYHWIYHPCMTTEGPVPFRTQVKVNFDLRRRNTERFPATPERDLAERVTLPQVAHVSSAGLGPSVRLRVLVGDDGRAMDSMLVSGSSAFLESAQESLARWKFEPAHWGNLAVPWYLDVDVPVGPLYRSQASAAPVKP